MDLPVGSDKVPLSGTTAEARPELTGTVEVDELVEFSIPEEPLPGDKGWDPKGGTKPAVTGRVQLRVVRTEKGTLDFHYRIVEVAPATRGLGWLMAYDYGERSCDVDYRTDGLGETPPEFALRAPIAAKPPGSAIYFAWADREGAGLRTPSHFFFVKTDAEKFEREDGGVILASSGGQAVGARLPGFRPAG